MTLGKKILLGCGILFALGLVAVAGCAGLIYYVNQPVPGVQMDVDLPTTVATGQRVPLTIRLTNNRPDKVAAVERIDLHPAFMAGFRLEGMTPPATVTTTVLQILSHGFDLKINPGETREIVFNLLALQPGHFAGLVVYGEGLRNTQVEVQTLVTGEPFVEPPAPTSPDRVPAAAPNPDEADSKAPGVERGN